MMLPQRLRFMMAAYLLVATAAWAETSSSTLATHGYHTHLIDRGSGDPQTEPQMQAYLDRVYHAPPTAPNVVRDALRVSRTLNDVRVIASVADALAAGQDVLTDDRVSAIAMPTLIVHGEGDGVVPVAASETLAARLPNARLSVIVEAGHWPQLEQPNAFYQLLSPFIR